MLVTVSGNVGSYSRTETTMRETMFGETPETPNGASSAVAPDPTLDWILARVVASLKVVISSTSVAMQVRKQFLLGHHLQKSERMRTTRNFSCTWRIADRPRMFTLCVRVARKNRRAGTSARRTRPSVLCRRQSTRSTRFLKTICIAVRSCWL